MSSLPKNQKWVSIGEAATFLGVSIDTIRRWDKQGKLHSSRSKENIPYFSLEALEKIKLSTPMNVEDQLDAEHLAQLVAEIHHPPKHPLIQKVLQFQRLFYTCVLFLLMNVIFVIAALTFFFLTFPEQTSQMLGYQPQATYAQPKQYVDGSRGQQVLAAEYNPTPEVSIFGKILRPFSQVSLILVSQIDKSIHEKIVPKQIIEDVNDILTVDSQGNIVPKKSLMLPDSSYLKTSNGSLEETIKTDREQAISSTPIVQTVGNGIGEGTGLVRSVNILDGTIGSLDLAPGAIGSFAITDGAVTVAKLAEGITLLGDNTVTSKYIKDGEVKSEDILDGTILDGDLADNAAIKDAKLAQITTANKVAGSAIQLAVGGGLTDSGGLSLKQDCTNGQILSWDGTAWVCASVSVGSAGIATIEEDDSAVVSSATALDFLGTDFTVTSGPIGEGNVGIDYANSGITRGNQNESVSGSWTFTNGTPLAFSNTAPTISIANTGALTVTDGANTLLSIADNGTTGVLTATGGLTVSSGIVALPNAQIDNNELANASLTVSAGSGLSGGGVVSLGGTVALASVLGTDINNAEIIADTIDFTALTDALILDAPTSITAGSTMNLTVGNNVTLTSSGTGAILATGLACTDCLGAAEISGLDIANDTNLSASDGIALGGNALTNTDKGSSQNIFKSFAVSGQSNVAADSNSDAVTFVAGANVILTTDASTDTITIAASDTNTTYSAGNDLDLSGTTFDLESTIDTVSTINLAGTGTINGLDAIDATSETTIENALDTLGNVTSANNLVSVGTLTGGATGAGFTLNFTDSTLSGNIIGSNIDESTLAGLTTANFTTGNVSQWTNNSGYITDGNTSWDNSYGFVTASSTDSFTNKSGNISQWTNNTGYLTANQSVTLSGAVSGSGTTSITTSLEDNAVTTDTIEDDAITLAKIAQNSCSDNQTIKWNGTSWACADDQTGATGNYATLNPSSADSATGTNPGLWINHGGSGNLMRLQNGGGTPVDRFVVSNAGVITTGSYQATAITDTYISDTLTISASGSVAAGALTGTIDNDRIADLTPTLFATSDVSQWTNDSGYLTSVDISADTNLSASDGITLTSDALTNTDKGSSQNIFKTIAVAGQSNVVTDANADTLTFAAGTNVTLTTDASTDTITINATDTNTTYTAGSDLDLTGTTFDLETTIDSVSTINLAGTGTLNGLDAVDGTTESTIEGTIDTLGNLTSASSLATVGTLTGGTTGAGFTLNFTDSTLSGDITGSNIDESTLTGLAAANFTSGAISQWTNDAGYVSDGNTNWNNSYGFITASSTDTFTNKSGNISQWTNDSGYLTVVDISGNTNLSASDGITLIGDALTNTDKGSSQNIFKTLAVAGQSNVVSDSNSDTMTLVGGSNITITTDASSDTITIAAAGGGSYTAGTDLDLNGSAFDLESTIDSVATINLAGTGTLNGLDAVDGTTESTIENAIDTLGNLTSASSLATVGTLTSGATGTGFTLNFTDSTLSGDITGANIDESTLTGLVAANFTSGNISQWTNDAGFISDGNTGWNNSYGFITASSPDALTNKTGNISMWTNDSGYLTTVDVSTNTNLSASNGVTLTGDALSLSSTSGGDGLTYTNGVLAVGAGSGISVAADSISATLGTSITNTEIDNDTVDLDKVADSLTLDAHLSLVSNSATNDFKLILDNSSTGDITELFEVTTSGTGATVGTALDLADVDIATAIALGSNDITVGGVTIDATEFARLNGIDAGLIDTNDGVVTAITGTGTLTAGATGTGFTLNFTNSTLTGNISGSNIDESTLAGLTTSNFSTANISQWTNNAGYLTTVDVSSNTNLSASDGITLTEDALTNTDKGSSQNIFKTIAVAGQSDVVSDANVDTLTFAAGTNVTLTTNAGTDTITINATDTNTTYSAGTDLDLTGTTFSLETTLDSVDILNLAGTGTINGLDVIDDTSETTIETAIDSLANLSTLTIGGDTITDFVGAGLQLSGSTLTATLGTSIANTELDNDTIDLDKVADTLVLDADLAFTAGSGLDIAFNKTFTNGTGENGLAFNFTASDGSSATTAQYGLYLDNLASTEGLDASLVIDNSDTDDAVGAAIKIINAGGGFTTIIDNAGTLISGVELNILDAGIAHSELTDSGTLTAGTVDINGGAIDGTTIGANSAAAGTFTTVTASGAIAANSGITFDAATDTVGAHTAAGTYNMNANLITNIGNSGTDFTASGGLTLADTLTTSANGVEFTESDTNPTCAAGNYSIYADTSEGKLKKCQNGVATDINAVPDANSFTDATTEAWVDADTTNLWDGTAPNITPKSTGSEVLVMMSAFINTTSLTDVNLTAKIMRHTSAITCQTVGTNVWTVGTQTGFTAGQVTMAAAFVDAPATTSNVQYTLCTDADSEAITGATMNTIQFTLFEINDAADLAEVYPTNDESLQVGEVVSFDPGLTNGIARTQKAYDKNALGVISTKPALVIGGRDGEGKTGKPVALSGRVPVKVKGPIKKGDMLTSSSTPGVAMKAVKAGPILGIALADYAPQDPSQVGSVMLFVKSGHFNGSTLDEIAAEENIDPNDSLAVLQHFVAEKQNAEGQVDLSEILTDKVVAGLEIITPRIVADEIIARSIKADRIEGLEIYTNKLANLEEAVLGLQSVSASSSAIPESQDETDSGQARMTNEKELDINSLNVDGMATVSGQLTTDGLRVKDSLLVETMAHIVDTLTSARIIVNDLATFFGKAVFKDDVAIDGKVALGKDTVGSAVVKKGADRVEVKFANAYEEKPIVNISLSIDEGQNDLEEKVLQEDIKYIITKRSATGFTIRLNKPATEDIRFSWTAFEPTVSGSEGISEGTNEKSLITPTVANTSPTIDPTPTAEVTGLISPTP